MLGSNPHGGTISKNATSSPPTDLIQQNITGKNQAGKCCIMPGKKQVPDPRLNGWQGVPGIMRLLPNLACAHLIGYDYPQFHGMCTALQIRAGLQPRWGVIQVRFSRS